MDSKNWHTGLLAAIYRKGCLFFLLVVVSLFGNRLFAQTKNTVPRSVYEQEHLDALQSILDLSPNVDQQMAIAKMKYPAHSANIYLQSYSSFIRLIAFEKPADGEAFRVNSIKSLDALALTNSPNVPVYRCNINLHSAVWEALQGNNLTAAHYFWAAYDDFEQIPATSVCDKEKQKLRSVFSIALSTIPSQYQWMVRWVMPHDDIDKANADLSGYLLAVNGKAGLADEGRLIQALVDLKVNEGIVGDVSGDCSLKPLLAYVRGLVALKAKKPNSSIARMDDDVCGRFPPLYYVKGRMLLNDLDLSSSSALRNFLGKYQGQSFKTDALLRLAWVDILRGNQDAACIQALQTLKINNVLPTYADRQAIHELSQIRHIDPVLLKSRLLYDGGHPEKTIELLASKTDLAVSNPFEYNYRLARAYHDLGGFQKALACYRLVMANNTDPQSYFAPYSALMSAKIEFELGNNAKGRELIGVCQTINKGEYKADIDNEAEKLLKIYGM